MGTTPPSSEATAQYIQAIRDRVGEIVVGQETVVERTLIALLTSGHLLLEGMPGLAKTLLVNTIARALHLDFRRIQFTIDLLPSDILGTEILDEKSGSFRTHKGPIFTNLLLTDEINRAAPKVQGALLEAMQERKVTLGNETFTLLSFLDRLKERLPAEKRDELATEILSLQDRFFGPGKDDPNPDLQSLATRWKNTAS